MEYWNHIYEHFNPVAFTLGPIPVHWYGLMYVTALFTAFAIAKWIIEKDKIAITKEQLDDFFSWEVFGVILGARLGYVFFYDPHSMYYLTHPWQIFNPFMDGQYVGIRGMSYHGAVIGFLIASYLYVRRSGIPFGRLMDVVAISVPLGYVFGRIGNFLNQELVGRATDVPWGIYVYDTLRHPSQLYEAFVEGIVVFAIIYLYRKRKAFEGELILVYGVSYGIGRGLVEFYRAPDAQIGYLIGNWLTLGMVLSFAMAAVAAILWIYFRSRNQTQKQ
ncbi:MAG: diacylglyceryl transferase [Sulfuricurvum sp. MLSB]|uniref:prolipoprotein diacylglyceryl transferase n=1 Tax=unclassified Sulfuricurvum TaxID=2632390 RepID=UPI0005008A66|nr:MULTISPECIES: prolipoprotein diacylglyceryl transferase [unclassified Sulfuricurvum]KFN40832.1 MAG: diacylglyceryl transferase [Sulfuricurvum sp. MLSB]